MPLNWHKNRTTRFSEQARTTHRRTEGPRTGFPGSDVGLVSPSRAGQPESDNNYYIHDHVMVACLADFTMFSKPSQKQKMDRSVFCVHSMNYGMITSRYLHVHPCIWALIYHKLPLHWNCWNQLTFLCPF